MYSIAILSGNSDLQKQKCDELEASCKKAGMEASQYPFQNEDYIEQMDLLLHANVDWILAYGLDILSVTMTGGDYFINKFSTPVLILLEEYLGDQLELLQKRMNVTILFYSPNPEDVNAIRTLPHPLFCGLIENGYQDINALIERAQKDLYEDL